MARRDEAAVRESVKAIAAAVVAPNAERVDREGVFPRENLEALAREGWNGVLLPEELGGLGLGHRAFAIATEERPLERAFRDARAAIAMGPSNNIAREWIGKTLVGLPLELFEAGGE
ncbi:acyl-CoA dehydrogenase family protein [Sorangium sp. So ce216]